MSAQNNIVIKGLRSVVSSSLGRLIVFKILCLALVVGGVAVAALSLSGAFAALVEYIPDNTVLRIVVGVIVVLVGIVGLLPVPKGSRQGRVISYPGERGTVAINLDSVEGSLTRALAKLPEVKKVVHLAVTPTDEQKVVVSAEVVPNKEPSVSMRELGYRLSDRIAEMAEHILGENEVATVDVTFPRLGEAIADLPPARVPAPAALPEASESVDEDAEASYEEEAPEETQEEESAEEDALGADTDDLIPGAGSLSAEEESGEDLEEPSGLELDLEGETQDEDDAGSFEDSELAQPVFEDEESPEEEVAESDDEALSGDAEDAEAEEPDEEGQEDNENQPGW